MPDMDGFEVANELKKKHNTAKIPIVFLTADKTQETIVKAFESGAVDYITKPFQSEELNVRVDNHIRSNQLQVELKKSSKNNIHLLEIINRYVSFIKISPSGIIQEISDNFCKQIQCDKESLIGKNISILKSGNTERILYKKIWETIQSEETFSFDVEDRNFSGGTNWYHVTLSQNYNDKNELLGYIAFYENIDEKMRFKYAAQTDRLTGLLNRAKIDDILQSEIKRASRNHSMLSVILVDIDYFKEVNDQYGHQTGDLILQEFATLLSNNIRETDFIGRWGGEEFLLICPHTDSDGAFALAENLRKRVELTNFSVIGSKTSSFGIAEFYETDTIENVFKNVDYALYNAKNMGRNQVQRYQ